MSTTSAIIIADLERAGMLPPHDDPSYELDVALTALRMIEAGGNAPMLARGALGLIEPEAYAQYSDEAAYLAVMLFAAPRPSPTT